jgi:predicted amidohydrolase
MAKPNEHQIQISQPSSMIEKQIVKFSGPTTLKIIEASKHTRLVSEGIIDIKHHFWQQATTFE